MLKVTDEPQRITLLHLICDEGLPAFLGGTSVCHVILSESRGFLPSGFSGNLEFGTSETRKTCSLINEWIIMTQQWYHRLVKPGGTPWEC